MKKLMTILGVSASLCAFCAVNGDVLPFRTGTSFEDYAAATFSPALSDAGVEGECYWYTADTDPTYTLTNYEGVASTTTPIDKRPDMFKDDVNGTYLMVETSAKTTPLFRTALPYTAEPEAGSFAPVTNTADKTIHLDTLVKFTPAESVFEASDLSGGDKIAIEYVEREEERDPTTDEITVQALTNFVIRAGYINSEDPIPQTNYVAKIPDNFEKDAWHRLTVRTVLDIDGKNSVGFVIYVDEVALEYDAEAIARTGEFAAAAGDNFTAKGLAANFYNDGRRALYPSAIQGGKDKFTISAAGFSGNGAIDDVTFSSKIDFIDDNEKVPVTFVVPAGVTSITVDGGEVDLNNPTTNLAADVETFELGVTLESGYTYIGISGAETNELGQVIVQKPSMAITILTGRNNAYYLDSGDNPVYFTKLSDAFNNAPAGSVIKLAYDYTATEWGDATDEHNPVYTITKDLVLDLNGKVLNGGSSNERLMFDIAVDIKLTVIDSAAGGTGKIVYGGSFGVFGGWGDAIIGSNDLTDYGPIVDGSLRGTDGWVGKVIRGKFLASVNTGYTDWDEEPPVEYPDAFSCELVLDDDSEATVVDDYWVVAPAGGSEPTEIAVPTAIEGLIYNKGEQTGVAAGTGYTLTGNVGTNATGYTAVATLEAGYAWVGGSTDPTNIEWSISMKGVTPTIVLNPTSAQFDPNKTTVGAYVTSVAAYDGEDLLTENLDYLVSGLTEEVTEAGEYKVWVVQKGWDPGQNYMITNSQYATLTITAGGSSDWPATWNGGTQPPSMATAFSNWIAAGNEPTAENAEAAFLVGVDVADYKSDLAAASISIVGGKIVITGNYNLSNVNGALAVKMGDAPNALGEPTAVTAVEGAISLTPALGETKKFYKLVIGYPAN